MSGIEIDAEEGNRMMREVAVYAMCGLTNDNPSCKQFYFERIIMSLGFSIRDFREKFPCEAGVAPDDIAEVCKTVEAMK